MVWCRELREEESWQIATTTRDTTPITIKAMTAAGCRDCWVPLLSSKVSMLSSEEREAIRAAMALLIVRGDTMEPVNKGSV